MTSRVLRLGTRGSRLARIQSELIAKELSGDDLRVEVVVVKTEGDQLQERSVDPDVPLPKGLFTGALEEELSLGKIDFAVHSMKDLPTLLPRGMVVAAVPVRGDARDVFVSNGTPFQELAAGSRIGTGSPRRVAQLQLLKPDLQAVPIRGNVDTRMKKLRSGEFDGLVLAAAGLARLGMISEVTDMFPTDRFLPAPGQGALAIESCDGEIGELLRERLDIGSVRACVEAERAVLLGVGGGCSLPLGAYAEMVDDEIHLTAVLFNEELTRHVRSHGTAGLGDAVSLGKSVAGDLERGLEGSTDGVQEE